MVQGYYTLQEAAQVLGMAPEELKQMAQKNQIRSFQDRGTWRFRVQDIQELARQRGAASDMELVLGDVKSTPPRSSGKGAKSPTKSPKPAAKPPDVFDFSLGDDENVGIGEEVLGERPSRRGAKPDSKRGPVTPSVPPGSDSDVRLVADNSDLDFVFDGPNRAGTSLASDSNVKLVGPDSGRQKSPGKSKLATPGRPAPDSPLPRKASNSPSQDSPVRLVPMDSDSDVKIVGAGSDEVSLGDMGSRAPTDSDIRLEPSIAKRSPGHSDEGMLTEEINLDEELKKAEAQRAQKPQAKVKPKSKLPKFPSASPFELSSDSELHLSPAASPVKPDSSDFDLTPAGLKPDSSDFDLAPAGAKPDSSDFDLSPAPVKPKDDSSDDFSLELPGDSDFSLDLGGSIEGELKGASSGISLGNPVDSGISLEQGGEGSDELEFELSVDAQATPKPAQAKAAKPESSEFELSLEDSGGHGLEPSAGDSSEFELTLDDSGSLPSLDEPVAKSGEKDIFETDFEVPGLEEESGSQVAALETDLDSSDFDLALDGSDVASDDDSGSNVVAVDEEADEGAATISAKRHPAGADLEADEDLGFEQIADEDAVAEIDQEDEELAPARRELVSVPARAAPWGVLPVIVMLPCVIVMFLVGMMGLELVQHMTGYKPPGFLTKAITELVGQKTK
ncbi:MAG: helix-turn-helix domain-containing protein [Planctomycetes bacterium]|nr:helix-turn-helix domain-containing protein [Planctomycetota bacterium]